MTTEGYTIKYKKKADNTRLLWWAMSATFSRSLRAQEFLRGRGLETFVPMRTVVRKVGRRKVRHQLPAVSNLIFVHSTEQQVQEAKNEMDYLQFICLHEGERRVRIIVPDEDMQHFMSVAGHLDEKTHYFNPEEINLKAGDRVRIHGGVFDGVEGVFVKVQGVRNRMVVVTIPTVISVATLSFQPELLEKLEDRE